MAQKQQEIVDLRAQEQWMKVGTGLADCISCGYKYDPKKGDPEYPINSGTRFQVRLHPHLTSQLYIGTSHRLPCCRECQTHTS